MTEIICRPLRAAVSRAIIAVLALGCSAVDEPARSPTAPAPRPRTPAPTLPTERPWADRRAVPTESAPRVTKSTCGPAPDNPHGHEWGTTVADGSCRPCERAPEALGACGRPFRALDVSRTTLRANVGKRVRFHGTIGYYGVTCTTRGGPCACENRCGALLRLWTKKTSRLPLPSKEDRRREADAITRGAASYHIEPMDPTHVALESASPDGGGRFSEYETGYGLACEGDENSLCCPFALDRDSLKVQVVVEGTLRIAQDPDDQPEFRLAVDDICRVPD